MNYKSATIEEYLNQIPSERKDAIKKILDLMEQNLPKGFEARINYSMPGYVVPHSLFPAGYHCDPKLPLPFINIASQKNFIALYHMGIYANPELLQWFQTEYKKHVPTKLDMGKSCIRFKKVEQIPYELLAELFKKMTPEEWIKIYKDAFVKK
ncbi:MAG: DUF1801 domain-containing protein [Bacteroidia bacterium]|jgi:uncharacterized protein YdhG (YjbR/CyaY superfamily)